MKNISTTCPDCGHRFQVGVTPGNANQNILAFFTPERLMILIGSPSLPDVKILCEHSPFKIIDNSTLDELDVESVGKAKYAHIIGPLILSIRTDE